MTDINEKIRKAAVINAIKHDGKAEVPAVLGSLLGESAELRSEAKQLIPIIRKIVNEVNATPLEELQKLAAANWPTETSKEKSAETRQLPPLPNAANYTTIVTRIAPNPDFTLHLGNARAAILSHDYARLYKGKFIVRFEDTDPRLKKAELAYYEMIRTDLKWLHCEWDEEYIQSDRLPTYYDTAHTLVVKGAGYVCECKPERFRALTNTNQPCPDRHLDAEEQEKRWQKMLTGEYKEGEAVLRIKTDILHPNPAVRDWPAMRIIDTDKTPHPRVGSKFKVWPLYNLASGTDDHLMGVTHIIRGKEHLTNMERQIFLYKHMGWKYPDAVHYGRLKVQGMNLSKSNLMKALELGEVTGVDDPRLGTLAALRRRGYNPETIRRLIWEVGPKPVDVTISWDNIDSLNRKIVDPTSHRYFFAPNPTPIVISGIPRPYVARIPLHQQHPEEGVRTLEVRTVDGQAVILIANSDVQTILNQNVRLMNLFNLTPAHMENNTLKSQFSDDTTGSEKAAIIQWVPSDNNIPLQVVMPDATVKTGVAERELMAEKVGAIVQLVRFGFCRIDQTNDKEIRAYFAHQ
jgi:glutamyl-tRNA synthetase